MLLDPNADTYTRGKQLKRLNKQCKEKTKFKSKQEERIHYISNERQEEQQTDGVTGKGQTEGVAGSIAEDNEKMN